jgi:signal peptidase I
VKIHRRRWLAIAFILLLLVAILPSYVRVYRVKGSSDLPTFRPGDRVVVTRWAFDLRIPYTRIVLISHSRPRRGDVVLYEPPDAPYPVFKRVVGCPGDRIAVRGSRLEINGVGLQYEPVNAAELRGPGLPTAPGATIAVEIGNGPAHRIIDDPARDHSFGPVEIPQGHYFMLGDNRANSRDSRHYGPIPRSALLGRVFRIG